MSTNRLQVTELDFDQIKTNLKTYLRSQSEFQDYDFEGSGLSVLLDILAYNTHYNAFYLNMVANESFLDSAVIRDSIVSHSKSLGYTPYSVKSPVATINVTATSSTTNQDTLTLPRGFTFISEIMDNIAYNFIVLEDTTATKANSQYFFENLDIYEGDLVSYNFSQNDQTNPKQIYTLPDVNIDTTTIRVTSIPYSGNNELTVYQQARDILDVTIDSNVYYLQETRNGRYQIYFGDNIIGKKIPNGTILTVSYLATNGPAGNRATNFIPASVARNSLLESPTFETDTVSPASGGSERESSAEIKFNAPTQFTTQNRLVTYKDYESYIKQNYPVVESLSVWGGEDETPPVFGKVFISLKPRRNYFISEIEKQRILNDIVLPKSVVTIQSEIIDPEILYILTKTKVRYNKNRTNLNAGLFTSTVRDSVVSYAETNLNRFDSLFVLSKLQEAIEDIDRNAITGTETTVRLQKRLVPEFGLSKTYSLNFNAPLRRGTITDGLESTQFDTLDRRGVRRTVRLEEIANSFTGISRITMNNPGSNYSTQPTVTITGDGTGATAIAKITNRRIESILVTNRGTGYTRALVTITGGGGFGASAIVELDARLGKLRTFYNDADANKQVVNEDAGTIDYDTGMITLPDLNVLSVNATDGTIRLTIGSENTILSSIKNTIITIDQDDAASIVTDLIEE